jgi:GNAT superfamily N-acetyltransferase
MSFETRLPLGWATDVMVSQLSGSSIVDHGDHVVIRSPENPHFHWGNCVLVTEAGDPDDADRWMSVFHENIPDADWVAIGLSRMPAAGSWDRHPVTLRPIETLATADPPKQTPPPQGYTFRPLAGDDWIQVIDRQLADNDISGEYDPHDQEAFLRQRIATQRRLCERGDAAFVGAFSAGRLVGELGIVRCGRIARYQDVGTAADHRRRGLASHLLGVAAQWAAERGCRRWVIVTEATNPAGRVYRAAGFGFESPSVSVYASR